MDKTNHIIMLIFAAVTLAIYAAVIGKHFYGTDPLPYISWGRTAVGAIFAILACMVFLLNVYLHVIVPWLYKRAYGSMEGYSSMSGLPGLCSFFVLFAGVLLPTSIVVGIVLLFILTIDPLGLPAALYVLLRYPE